MAETAKFECYNSGFVRDEFVRREDARSLTEDEINEVLGYKNVSKPFEMRDWFGDSTNIIATLTNVERGKAGSFIFTIKVNKQVPKHYIPSPSEVLRHQGLLYPTSVRCL